MIPCRRGQGWRCRALIASTRFRPGRPWCERSGRSLRQLVWPCVRERRSGPRGPLVRGFHWFRRRRRAVWRGRSRF